MSTKYSISGIILKTILGIIIFELFVFLSGYCAFIQDDSFISLQYAKNFFEGKGLVFNVGENVEGYTSFLWVLILTLPFLIKVDPIAFIQFLSLGFGVLVLIVSFFITDILLRKSNNYKYSYFSFITPFFTAISGTYYYWATSGMETTLYAFLFLTSIYFFISSFENFKHTYYSFFFLMLAFLTRQEVAILLLIYIISLTICYKKYQQINLIMKLVRNVFVLFVLPATIYLLFRFYYYGYIFPNTFYAKTGTSANYIYAGVDYTITFYKTYAVYGMVILLPLFLLKSSELKNTSVFLFSIILGYTLYVIWIGGDVLAFFRFYTNILPLIFILFSVWLKNLTNKLDRFLIKKVFKNIFALCVVFGLAYYIYNSSFNQAITMSAKEKGLVGSMKSVGLALKNEKVAKKKKLIVAASTIGALKYYSECYILDMLGLTDETIAHNPIEVKEISGYSTGWKERNYNTKYTLDRKPDYIIFSTQEKPSSFAERALFTEVNFLNNYYVYPLALVNIKTYRNVYKKCSPIQLKLRSNNLENKNTNYKNSFVNDYNLFLNQFNSFNENELVKALNSLIFISPSNFSEPYRFIAKYYYKNNKYAEATKYADKCLVRDSLNLYSSLILYNISKQTGNNKKAKKIEKFIINNFYELFKDSLSINNFKL